MFIRVYYIVGTVLGMQGSKDKEEQDSVSSQNFYVL